MLKKPGKKQFPTTQANKFTKLFSQIIRKKLEILNFQLRYETNLTENSYFTL